MKVSPNGQRLALTQIDGPTEVFDFNADASVVSNARVLATIYSNYSVEFSPNSNLLYVTADGELRQFDLVRGTQAIISKFYFGALQLGPDGQMRLGRCGGRHGWRRGPAYGWRCWGCPYCCWPRYS